MSKTAATTSAQSSVTTSVIKPNLVIIGNGIAGIRTLDELLSAVPDHYQITVIGNEPFGSYNRIMLSPLLAGETDIEQILIHDRDWYREHEIELLAGEQHEAVAIDRLHQQVICRDGYRLSYDRLLIATGSTPITLPLDVTDLTDSRSARNQTATISLTPSQITGVLGFRGIRDVERMRQLAQAGGSAVVIGAGLLGLEAAHGLNQLGMDVTVIHRSGYPLNRQLDKEAALLLQQQLQERGIKFRFRVNSQQLLSRNGRVCALQLDGGEQLAASLVVMAIGISPNTALASSSGLHCQQGILVNDCMQTYDPKIYAVGECVEHRNTTFGLVEPLFQQASVCANHLAGHGVASYRYQQPSTRLKVSGINLFSMGDFDPQPATAVLNSEGFEGDKNSAELIHYRDLSTGVYKKLVIRDNRLVGAVLYGDTADGPWYYQLMQDQTDLQPLRSELIFGQPEQTAGTPTVCKPADSTVAELATDADIATQVPSQILSQEPTQTATHSAATRRSGNE
ncbi:MAG: FAD-dependent oxidoreductase [Motiliproteus sp.]